MGLCDDVRAACAEIAREKTELAAEPIGELRELAAIYEQRGLTHELALQVATQLSEHDRLGAHVRDELGILDETRARPLMAAARFGLRITGVMSDRAYGRQIGPGLLSTG